MAILETYVSGGEYLIGADETRDMQSQIRKHITQLDALIKQAVVEPQLWHTPFPSTLHEQLVDHLRNFNIVLINMDRSIRYALGTVEQFELFVFPLKSLLKDIEQNAMSRLTSIMEVMGTRTFSFPSSPILLPILLASLKEAFLKRVTQLRQESSSSLVPICSTSDLITLLSVFSMFPALFDVIIALWRTAMKIAETEMVNKNLDSDNSWREGTFEDTI